MSRVGVVSADITPPLGIEFIGYHRTAGIQSANEKIYATAFVFEHRDETLVVVSIDNEGMLIEDTTVIRRAISSRIGVPISKIMILFTHTHSGPATVGSDSLVAEYRTSLTDKVGECALLAYRRMQPVEIGWGLTNGEICINRRELDASGRAKMGTNLAGVVDRRIGVLLMRDAYTDTNLGCLVFCTGHPNVLKGDNYSLSSDYPGRTREILQRTLACPIAIIQGRAGNVNARYRGSMRDLEKMALMLSGHVLTTIPEMTFNPITNLKGVSNSVRMSLKQIPDESGIRQMAKVASLEWGVDTTEWIKGITDRAERNRRLIVDLEIQQFALNEGSYTGNPMEPFYESSLKVRDVLGNNLAFFGGYMNGYLGYLPTKAAFAEGGYEVELNPVVYGPLTGLWVPPHEDTADLIVDTVCRLCDPSTGI